MPFWQRQNPRIIVEWYIYARKILRFFIRDRGRRGAEKKIFWDRFCEKWFWFGSVTVDEIENKQPIKMASCKHTSLCHASHWCVECWKPFLRWKTIFKNSVRFYINCHNIYLTYDLGCWIKINGRIRRMGAIPMHVQSLRIHKS